MLLTSGKFCLVAQLSQIWSSVLLCRFGCAAGGFVAGQIMLVVKLTEFFPIQTALLLSTTLPLWMRGFSCVAS